ncbi:MAG TPA: methylmalonyl Co-A mutase-associated GTPase MeaB [Candidatus Deferrimicrobium sp.]|nr:methylmalonyl Co-A mutase-associated GTPase MeaB [Candidatus Deferrimicrobium sp.]
MELLERLAAADIRALAKAVSCVENQDAGYRELLGQVYHQAGRSQRIGITGPPGAGKSTLVNTLTHEFLSRHRKVGIIAVDPTSPFTGGALLGDRIRMSQFPTDGSVYFRSMATRGATGGLAAATNYAAVIYDAFGFDVTMIETIGVGQMELDVVDACDTVVVVVTPESGDAVQTMKAGLMEIAHVFCVNKADRPGSERVAFELRQAMDVRIKLPEAWSVPVVATQAVNGKNVDQLYQHIAAHLAFIQAGERVEDRRREQIRKMILSVLRQRFQQEFVDVLPRNAAFNDLVTEVYAGRCDPFRASDLLFEAYTRGIQPGETKPKG